jgi:hypothetical protein
VDFWDEPLTAYKTTEALGFWQDEAKQRLIVTDSQMAI